MRPILFHHEGEDHLHEHTHAHDHAQHNCAACTAHCDPMQETTALMDYMVKHNTAHANELAALAKKVDELGNHAAAEQIRAAVSEFEKGNLRLAAVLASLR